MKKTLHEFYVAGVQFHQLKTVIKDIQVGDPLTLVADPSNKYDPNAVKIEWDNDGIPTMLGHVPMKKDMSAQVAAALTIEPLYCAVLEVNPELKTWEQLKVEIYSMEEDG